MGGEPITVLDKRRRGTKLADMTGDQRQAVADWARNCAGASFWRAQADPAGAAGHLAAAEQLRGQAERIESELTHGGRVGRRAR